MINTEERPLIPANTLTEISLGEIVTQQVEYQETSTSPSSTRIRAAIRIAPQGQGATLTQTGSGLKENVFLLPSGLFTQPGNQVELEQFTNDLVSYFRPAHFSGSSDHPANLAAKTPENSTWQIASRRVGDEVVTIITPPVSAFSTTHGGRALLDFTDPYYLSQLENFLDQAETACDKNPAETAIVPLRRIIANLIHNLPQTQTDWWMFTLDDPEGTPAEDYSLLASIDEDRRASLTAGSSQSWPVLALKGSTRQTYFEGYRKEPHILLIDQIETTELHIIQDTISPQKARSTQALIKSEVSQVINRFPVYLRPNILLVYATDTYFDRSGGGSDEANKSLIHVFLKQPTDSGKESTAFQDKEARKTTQHETVHAVLEEKFGSCHSSYLAEGMAMYYGSHQHRTLSQTVKEAQQTNSHYYLRGQIIQAISEKYRLQDVLSFKVDDSVCEYYGGTLLVEYLEKLLGQDGLLKTYQLACSNKAKRFESTVSDLTVLQSVIPQATHLSFDQFMKGFTEYLQQVRREV